MSWTLRNKNENGTSSGTSTSVVVTGVVAGDVVVAAGMGANATVTSISDGTSTFTKRAENNFAANGLRQTMAYLLASVASGSVTYTVNFDASANSPRIHIWVYTASGTPQFDVSREDAQISSTTAPDSGAITTTGTDELVVTACYSGLGALLTTPLVNSAAADGQQASGTDNGNSWAKAVSGTFTGNGTGTLSASTNVVVSILALKMAGGGGETITVDKWQKQCPDVIRRKWGVVPSGTTGIKA